jgi:hypothetical protein
VLCDRRVFYLPGDPDSLTLDEYVHQGVGHWVIKFSDVRYVNEARGEDLAANVKWWVLRGEEAEDSCLCLRVIRPIATGEELLLNYISDRGSVAAEEAEAAVDPRFARRLSRHERGDPDELLDRSRSSPPTKSPSEPSEPFETAPRTMVAARPTPWPSVSKAPGPAYAAMLQCSALSEAHRASIIKMQAKRAAREAATATMQAFPEGATAAAEDRGGCYSVNAVLPA